MNEYKVEDYTPKPGATYDVASILRDVDYYGDMLVRLANDVLELAYSLDYEIGGAGQTLSELAAKGIIELPTKRVTIEGTLVRHYEYKTEIDVPIFDDVNEIDHNDYIDEIVVSPYADDVTHWQLDPGSAYHNA